MARRLLLACGLLLLLIVPARADDKVLGASPAIVQPRRIGRVKIEGNKFYSTAFIHRMLAPVLEQKTLRYETLERTLLILNEYMDLRVKAVLEAGAEPGTTDITIQVHDEAPRHFTADYNNFGSRFTGENRGGVTWSMGNATGHGDTLLVRAVEAFPSIQSSPFTQLIYEVPLHDAGDRLGISLANGAFIVGQELTVLNIQGQSQSYGLTWTHPLQRTPNAATDLTTSFYSKNYNNFIFGNPSSQDQIREIAVGLSGHFYPGRAPAVSYELGVTQGLGSIFGGTAIGDPLVSRKGASDNFTKLNVDAAQILRIGQQDFLILRGSAQASVGGATPLVIGEQFPLGGPDSVRGFTQSIVLGDDGWVLSAELRVPVGKHNDTQAAFFVDTGAAYLLKPNLGEVSFTGLTGAGFGLRAERGHMVLRADLGFPLSSSLSGTQRQTGSILYGQVQSHF